MGGPKGKIGRVVAQSNIKMSRCEDFAPDEKGEKEMYTPNYNSIWEVTNIISKLVETPILLNAAEKKKAYAFLRKSYSKKYDGITPQKLVNFSVERVIQAVHASLDERDEICKKSGEIAAKIKNYMKKHNLNSVLIDSKKHGKLLLDLGYSDQLGYSSNPGKTERINGKEFYIIKYNCPDKIISSVPLFELFASRKDVWWDYAKKYAGLTGNLYLFLGLKEYEDEDSWNKARPNPIILTGEGLTLIPDGPHKGYRVERTKDVSIKL